MTETVVPEAKKTTKKKASKKTNEEKEEVKKEIEEALKNEALDFYRQLIERNLPHFDGASIDFHQKRDPVVFIPGENPVIAAVKKEELLDFLVKNDVRRVLVDELFPSRAEILSTISKAGIEVYFIRRLTVIRKFRRFLREKLKIEVRKNDYADAVLQAFIKPKYLQQIDWKYIDCLLEMHLWRDNSKDYQKYRQKPKTYPPAKRHKIAKLIADIEKTAQEFVDTVVAHYPNVEEHFKKFGITDIVTKAYYCEVYLEMIVCRSFAGVLKKAGIDVSQKAHLKKLEQRRQKEEEKDGEEQSKDEKEKEKTFIYDGKFANALNQLTIKVRRLNPYKKKHKQIIPVATILLAKEIWMMLLEEERKQKGDGRVGEALGWRAGPLFSRGLDSDHPRLAGGLRKQERFLIIRPWSKAPNTRPTGNYHNHCLTHPFFPSYTYQFTASMGSLQHRQIRCHPDVPEIIPKLPTRRQHNHKRPVDEYGEDGRKDEGKGQLRPQRQA